MNRTTVWVISLAVVAAGYLYYRKRSADIAQAQLNPNQSASSQLGELAAQYPDRYTGQTGGAYYSNQRYSEYLDYLKQGGVNSSYSTFNQYLTATQGQSLPTNG